MPLVLSRGATERGKRRKKIIAHNRGSSYVHATSHPLTELLLRSTTAVREGRAPNNTAPTAFPDSVWCRHVFTFLLVEGELAGTPCTVTATFSVTRFGSALTQCECRPLRDRQVASTVPSTGLHFHTASCSRLAGKRTTSLPVHN